MNHQPGDERERADTIVRQRLTGREPLLKLGPVGMRRLKIIAIIVVILMTLYVLVAPPHYSWRQKLTISIRTPEGMIEGSAVTQVDLYDLSRHSLGLPEASGANSSFTGEALAVKLAQGRALFVLLQDHAGYGGPTDWPAVLWYRPGMELAEWMAVIKNQRGKEPVPLPQKHWPMIVTFTDLSRPETLEVITGTDLSRWFGPGVQMERLTVQITRDAITEGRIEKLLPWLRPAGFERGLVDPASTPAIPLDAFLSNNHWRRD